MADSNSKQLLDYAKQLRKQADLAQALAEVDIELANRDDSTWQDWLDSMAERGFPMKFTYISHQCRSRKANLGV